MDERATSPALRWQDGAWAVVARLDETDGSVAHPWFRRLLGAEVEHRDLADAVHFLCTLYGHHPSLIDEAFGRHALPGADEWLARMSADFAIERTRLAHLTACAGPLPSTPGHAAAHAAVTNQRHALSVLARSDRGGCAVGAVAALMLDWGHIRALLAVAAERFGTDGGAPGLPDMAATARSLSTFASSPAAERAVAFGAQQLLAQHRGLWSLLEARASARRG